MSEQNQNIFMSLVVLILLYLIGSLLGLSFNPIKWEILLRLFWSVPSGVIVLYIIANIVDP